MLCGCGDDDHGSPAEKCDDLLNLACQRVEECGEQLTGETAPDTFQKECVDWQRTGADCSEELSVRTTRRVTSFAEARFQASQE
jgi:hypothetical protein